MKLSAPQATLYKPPPHPNQSANAPPQTSPHPLTGLESSNSTTHHKACLALPTSPLNSCALAKANHPSESSHPAPNFVKLASSIYALSLAARRFSSAGVGSFRCSSTSGASLLTREGRREGIVDAEEPGLESAGLASLRREIDAVGGGR